MNIASGLAIDTIKGLRLLGGLFVVACACIAGLPSGDASTLGPLAAMSTSLQHSTERPSESDTIASYPPVYRFAVAHKLAQQGELERALWYYIHLFQGNPHRVLREASAMGLGADELAAAIRSAFTAYAPPDPRLTLQGDGEPEIDSAAWQRTAALAGRFAAAVLRQEPTELPDPAATGFAGIRSERGVMFIINLPESYCTIELAGDSIAPLDGDNIMLRVDGSFVQLLSVAVDDIVAEPDAKLRDERILRAHFDFEMQYLKETLQRDIAVDASLYTTGNGKECLYWEFAMPDDLVDRSDPNAVVRQIYLTSLFNRHLLVANSIVTAGDSVRQVRELLRNSFNSLEVYLQPLDIASLQQGLRDGG